MLPIFNFMLDIFIHPCLQIMIIRIIYFCYYNFILLIVYYIYNKIRLNCSLLYHMICYVFLLTIIDHVI